MFFFVLAVLVLASSLLVVFQRNPVHSAVALIATLFFMAVLFLTLEAPMLAVLQIFVYAGAIMVIFLFVIMLLNPRAVERERLLWWGLGSLVTIPLALELVFLLGRPSEANSFGKVSLPSGFGSPRMLGETLFRDFLVPFEIASVLLLVAIIGAVVLAKRQD